MHKNGIKMAVMVMLSWGMANLDAGAETPDIFASHGFYTCAQKIQDLLISGDVRTQPLFYRFTHRDLEQFLQTEFRPLFEDVTQVPGVRYMGDDFKILSFQSRERPHQRLHFRVDALNEVPHSPRDQFVLSYLNDPKRGERGLRLEGFSGWPKPLVVHLMGRSSDAHPLTPDFFAVVTAIVIEDTQSPEKTKWIQIPHVHAEEYRIAGRGVTDSVERGRKEMLSFETKVTGETSEVVIRQPSVSDTLASVQQTVLHQVSPQSFLLDGLDAEYGTAFVARSWHRFSQQHLVTRARQFFRWTQVSDGTFSDMFQTAVPNGLSPLGRWKVKEVEVIVEPQTLVSVAALSIRLSYFHKGIELFRITGVMSSRQNERMVGWGGSLQPVFADIRKVFLQQAEAGKLDPDLVMQFISSKGLNLDNLTIQVFALDDKTHPQKKQVLYRHTFQFDFSDRTSQTRRRPEGLTEAIIASGIAPFFMVEHFDPRGMEAVSDPFTETALTLKSEKRHRQDMQEWVRHAQESGDPLDIVMAEGHQDEGVFDGITHSQYAVQRVLQNFPDLLTQSNHPIMKIVGDMLQKFPPTSPSDPK